ncbi:hypothetical protein DK26_15615 [Bosea sp. WAO]|nr:hypothetical protein DK26_15615 [Bosea sp. WAO]
MRPGPKRSISPASRSALAAVPMPKAAEAAITAGTVLTKLSATRGAIGPSASEFAPMSPMHRHSA